MFKCYGKKFIEQKEKEEANKKKSVKEDWQAAISCLDTTITCRQTD